MTDTAFSRAQTHASLTAGLRSELVAERDALVQQRAEIATRIAEYDKLIAELTPAGLAKTIEPEPKKDDGPKSPRATGTKPIVERIVRELQSTRTWSKQDEVIQAATMHDARLQSKSIVSALGRLVEEGVLLREGKRGSFRYALATITQEEGPPVPELSGPELILGKLRTSVSDGVSKRDLCWAVGDVSLGEQALNKLLADGEIRLAENTTDTYVLAERVQHQRPLFDQAMPPEPTTE